VRGCQKTRLADSNSDTASAIVNAQNRHAADCTGPSVTMSPFGKAQQ
jgi:hypothetical protein